MRNLNKEADRLLNEGGTKIVTRSVMTQFERSLNYLVAASHEFFVNQTDQSFKYLKGAMTMMDQRMKERK